MPTQHESAPLMHLSKASGVGLNTAGYWPADPNVPRVLLLSGQPVPAAAPVPHHPGDRWGAPAPQCRLQGHRKPLPHPAAQHAGAASFPSQGRALGPAQQTQAPPRRRQGSRGKPASMEETLTRRQGRERGGRQGRPVHDLPQQRHRGRPGPGTPGAEAQPSVCFKGNTSWHRFRTLNSAHGATWSALIWLSPLAIGPSHLLPKQPPGTGSPGHEGSGPRRRPRAGARGAGLPLPASAAGGTHLGPGRLGAVKSRERGRRRRPRGPPVRPGHL